MLPNDIYTNQNLSWKIKHEILWDFEIQTDHIFPARWLVLVTNDKKKKKKKKQLIRGLCRFGMSKCISSSNND